MQGHPGAAAFASRLTLSRGPRAPGNSYKPYFGGEFPLSRPSQVRASGSGQVTTQTYGRRPTHRFFVGFLFGFFLPPPVNLASGRLPADVLGRHRSPHTPPSPAGAALPQSRSGGCRRPPAAAAAPRPRVGAASPTPPPLPLRPAPGEQRGPEPAPSPTCRRSPARGPATPRPRPARPSPGKAAGRPRSRPIPPRPPGRSGSGGVSPSGTYREARRAEYEPSRAV